jgi:single-stranded DNA-binding protein
MNKMFQRGNLGGSPVIKTTAAGVVYARFSYAVNVLDRDGNRKPQWWSAVAFGKLAQTLGKLQTGDEILVEGEPHETHYEKDGIKHRTFEVRVQRVEFLRLKPRDNGDGAAAPDDNLAGPEAGEDHPADPGPAPDASSDPQSDPESHPTDEPPTEPELAEPDQPRRRFGWRKPAA